MVQVSPAPHPEHIPEGKRAESPLSGTCSGGVKGMSPPGSFSRRLLFWTGETIGAASLFILLFILLFIGSAIQ